MAATVAVYHVQQHHRSKVVCDAMARGLKQIGERFVRLDERDYTEPLTQVAVFYGLEGRLRKIFRDYARDGRCAVYVDLGYWGRREGGRWSGYHKVVVNARHPNAYFQARKHDDSRAKQFGLLPQEWKKGHHILIAGMGDKGARAEGYEPEQWERDAIAKIREHSRRPIIYRPKPSWKRARPIQGVGFSQRTQDVTAVLNGAHAVVTHHSNVAVEGIVAGIPAFCWGGVAQCMSLQDLSSIESPLNPEGREQWIADIAWCQWSITEMTQGLPWRHLKDEGLIP